MPKACEAFRDAWLEHGVFDGPEFRVRSVGVDGGGNDGGTADHEGTCSACAQWVRTAEALAGPFVDMVAPDSLLHRVAIELEEPAARFGRAFARLTPLTAPAALAEAVDRDLRSLRSVESCRASDMETWELSTVTVKALRCLRPPTAPAVLDRLVDEELRSPQTALASRWIGGLSPLSAPDLLAERLQSLSGGVGNRLGSAAPPARAKSVLRGPLGRGSALLAAAALLLVVALRGAGSEGGDESQPLDQRWAFRVVVVDDASELGPIAAGLLGAISGGFLPGEAQ